MLYIKNGMVIDPDEDRVYQADIKIEDGKVTGIYPMSKEGKDEELPKGITKGEEEKDRNGQVIDAGGLMIAPGLADTHVHFRDPGFTYKEDIDTGAAAAAKGLRRLCLWQIRSLLWITRTPFLMYLRKGKRLESI